jgi:hypothetical protein
VVAAAVVGVARAGGTGVDGVVAVVGAATAGGAADIVGAGAGMVADEAGAGIVAEGNGAGTSVPAIGGSGSGAGRAGAVSGNDGGEAASAARTGAGFTLSAVSTVAEEVTATTNDRGDTGTGGFEPFTARSNETERALLNPPLSIPGSPGAGRTRAMACANVIRPSSAFMTPARTPTISSAVIERSSGFTANPR